MDETVTTLLDSLPEENFLSRNDHFAVSLTILRIVCRMSQGDLATAAGVTNSAISDYERGKVDPQSQTLYKLLRGLGLPLSIFEETYTFIEMVRARIGATPADSSSQPRPGSERERQIAVVAAEVGRVAAQMTRLHFQMLGGG